MESEWSLNTSHLDVSENWTAGDHCNITLSENYRVLHSVTHNIQTFYVWIVFAFGFPGNIFSVFVINKLSKRSKSTSCFLVAVLAIVDNIAILLKIVRNQIQNQRLPMTNASCRVLYFVGLSVTCFASWILVTLAVERLIAVTYPLKLAVVWSVRKVVVLLSVVFGLLCCIHLHLVWTLNEHENYMCQLSLEAQYVTIWFYISSCVYAVIPAVLLVMCNAVIIHRVRASTRKRKALMGSANRNNIDRDNQLTVMLLTVSFVFIVLSFPRCVFTVIYNYWQPLVCTTAKANKDFLDVLSSNLADTNHAVNFYLYFLSGKRFRATAFNRQTSNSQAPSPLTPLKSSLSHFKFQSK